jgi:hypothetical protein
VVLSWHVFSKTRFFYDNQVANEEFSTSARDLRAELEATQSKLDAQRALNDKLENDLLHIHGSRSSANVSPVPRQDPLANLSLGVKSPPVMSYS